MKTTYSLGPEDLLAAILANEVLLKQALISWMGSRGIAVNAADDFTIDSSGDVTIICSNAPESSAGPVLAPISPVAQPPIATTGQNQVVPPTTIPVAVLVAAPAASQPLPGHYVAVDPPLSVTGQATMFGLNWDGSIDQSDNGQGFFYDPATGKPYDTHNQKLVGCSLPREVLLSTFLKIDSWKTDGIIDVWSRNGSTLRQWVDGNKPLLTIDSGGLSARDVVLVDAGPTAGTDNSIDLTYATAHILETNGKALATYMILVAGQPIPIRGWNWATGRVG